MKRARSPLLLRKAPLTHALRIWGQQEMLEGRELAEGWKAGVTCTSAQAVLVDRHARLTMAHFLFTPAWRKMMRKLCCGESDAPSLYNW